MVVRLRLRVTNRAWLTAAAHMLGVTRASGPDGDTFQVDTDHMPALIRWANLCPGVAVAAIVARLYYACVVVGAARGSWPALEAYSAAVCEADCEVLP
jgi:hypothetical protein